MKRSVSAHSRPSLTLPRKADREANPVTQAGDTHERPKPIRQPKYPRLNDEQKKVIDALLLQEIRPPAIARQLQVPTYQVYNYIMLSRKKGLQC